MTDPLLTQLTTGDRRSREPGWTLSDEIYYTIKVEDERDRYRQALWHIRSEVEPAPLDDLDREVLRIIDVALGENRA
ncbi:MAG: hypothetical protein JWM47_4521 [Acidimicrobiales bacterium]|nr:hypothetical protein [Acidimicrobiales bacterium]